MLIALAGINEGFDATHIPSYGTESRSGTSYADVHVAADVMAAERASSAARLWNLRTSGRLKPRDVEPKFRRGSGEPYNPPIRCP